MSPRKPLPELRDPRNMACPTHGPTFLAGPNKNGDVICLSCGWTAPYDHKAVLAPRVKPTRMR